MNLSITPYRWYDQYYKQNRFDRDCSSTCEFKLITHRGALLPFQFTRPASGYVIDKWLLRSACVDFEPKMLNEYNSRWATGHTWVNDGGFVFDCGVAKSGQVNNDELSLAAGLTVGKKYRITVSCADLVLAAGSTLNIVFRNSTATNILSFNSLGFYEAEFTATAASVQFVIQNSGSVGVDDFIGLSDVQIFEVFEQKTADIVLDTAFVKLVSAGALDYFIYCGGDLGQSLPTGDYYSVILETSGDTYVSEVITVKNFLPAKSPYYKLEWNNSCDIGSIIYQDVDSCLYKNILYLDEAVATRPEYPYEEKGELDGNQVFQPTFQKLEKKLDFIIAKCPEFIVDAIAGINLHDTISLTAPLRIEQVSVDDAIAIQSVEPEFTPVFNDCFTKIDLKIMLTDLYLDSACCTDVAVDLTCETCRYQADYLNGTPVGPSSGDTHLVTESEDAGFYRFIGGIWVLQVIEENDLICFTAKTYVHIAGAFFLVPSISEADSGWFPAAGGLFHIQGNAFPGSWVDVQYRVGGAWVSIGIITSSSYTLLGVDLTFADDDESVVEFRIRNFSLACDYGYSAIFEHSFIPTVSFMYDNSGGTMTPGEDIHNVTTGADSIIVSNDGVTIVIEAISLTGWNIGNRCNNIAGDEITINSVPVLV
ncbi:MAG: hypothetical protein M3R27_05835 [Bacteroidota bacterium]|nr:hypothetical protein [Bacteroidota bacterium]